MEAFGSRGLISATTQHLVQGTAHSKADKTEMDLGWQGGSWMLGEFPQDQGQQWRARWGTGLSHP